VGRDSVLGVKILLLFEVFGFRQRVVVGYRWSVVVSDMVLGMNDFGLKKSLLKAGGCNV
jgi:hypothetical protein